ncbi:MAG: 4-deoxy-4-formamido-L-arabinose-phosphoundecaprenol deformylase [Burkholderiales bacterium]
MKLALRIEVATARGLRIGVPNLLRALAASRARASFFFNLGPDHSGRALARTLRPTPAHRGGWMARQWGLGTLLSGTLMPAPELGRRYRDVMRFARDSGFEAGLLAWDHAGWRTGAALADARWTRQDLVRGVERFTDVFGAPPVGHAAPRWQMNVHAWRLLQQLGFGYGTDSRGFRPFLPVYNAELVACPQIPTTWPVLDEWLGVSGAGRLAPEQVPDRLLAAADAATAAAEATSTAALHVWTVRAEFEGIRLLPVLEAVLAAWVARDGEVVAVGDIAAGLDLKRLPRHAVSSRTRFGAPPAMALQEAEFLVSEARARLHA